MLSMPSPRTRMLPPAAFTSSRHGCRSAASMTSSSSSPVCLTLSCGTAAAALAWPKVKVPLLSRTSPLIVPPRPSDRMVRGPVTRAPTSSRLRSCACWALKDRFSAATPPEKSTVPVPSILPPPAVVPASRLNTRREPLKRPSVCNCSIRVPVTALSSRALLERTEPRMVGSTRRPPMSAPIATGPVRSNSSMPESRHKVSAGPA